MKRLAKDIKSAINDFNFATDVRYKNITPDNFKQLEDLESQRHTHWRNVMATVLLKHKVITLEQLPEFCD